MYMYIRIIRIYVDIYYMYIYVYVYIYYIYIYIYIFKYIQVIFLSVIKTYEFFFSFQESFWFQMWLKKNKSEELLLRKMKILFPACSNFHFNTTCKSRKASTFWRLQLVYNWNIYFLFMIFYKQFNYSSQPQLAKRRC